jgi:hypothetical protein
MNIKTIVICVIAAYVIMSVFSITSKKEDGSSPYDSSVHTFIGAFSWVDITIGIAIAYLILRYALKMFT